VSEQDFIDPQDDPFDPNVQRKAEEVEYNVELTKDEKVKEYINRRALAYKRVFADPNKSEDVKVVMEDLAFWSRAFETTWDANSKKQDLLEGRRETYLRIAKQTHLSFDQLFKIYTDALTRTE